MLNTKIKRNWSDAHYSLHFFSCWSRKISLYCWYWYFVKHCILSYLPSFFTFVNNVYILCALATILFIKKHFLSLTLQLPRNKTCTGKADECLIFLPFSYQFSEQADTLATSNDNRSGFSIILNAYIFIYLMFYIFDFI